MKPAVKRPSPIILLVMKILFLILLLSSLAVKGQHLGPSLTASASKIAFEKGALDTEMIAEIIAGKQEEIKKELMSRTVLNCLECGSFTTWNYTRQAMDVLLNERDTRVITKEMLRYTTELAVVMGLAEFYLQDLGKRSLDDELNHNEKKFLLQYFKWMDLDSKQALPGTFLPPDTARYFISQDSLARMKIEELDRQIEVWGENTHTLSREQLETNRRRQDSLLISWPNLEDTSSYYQVLTLYSQLGEQKKSLDMSDDDVQLKIPKDIQFSGKGIENAHRSKYLSKVVYLKIFNNSDYKEKKSMKYNKGLFSYCQGISPNHILIDMVYDICKSNKILQGYGFFQNTGVGDSTYFYKNKYTIFLKKKHADYKIVKPEIENLINFLFQTFSSVNELYKEGEELSLDGIEKLKNQRGNTVGFRTLVQSIFKLEVDSINLSIHEDWGETLDLLKTLAFYDGEQNDDLLYFIREKVQPALLKMDMASAKDFSGLRVHLEKYENYLAIASLDSLHKNFVTLSHSLRGDALLKLNLGNFIQLVQTINNLDDPLTYDVLAKFLTNLGGVFGDSRAAIVFNRLINDFDKYLIIDQEEEQLTLNVEDIAVDLYHTFGKSQSMRVGPYFSVGMNQGLWVADKAFNKAGTDGLDTTALYYASEKIGIKWSIIDRNRQQAFGPGKTGNVKTYHKTGDAIRKPILTDVHTMLFASGLLYKVDFLNSESGAFNNPVIGLGVGVSFFNGLDLNLSYGGTLLRIKNNLKHGMLSLSFDIKIAEYLSALTKKKG